MKDKLLREVEELTYNLMKDSLGTGAVVTASMYLGFNIEDLPLSEEEASQFHKFVKPIMETYWLIIAGDPKRQTEFKEFYKNSTPAELLAFLVNVKMTERT